ncbi:MAG: hypothetical protein KDA37_05905 [Planctomycetales bacterium]|nr:hypothetical protein [Planctomycetales bacterium]
MRAGSWAACPVAVFVLLATGCQSQPGAPMAPMLSADRVPPPATRTAAPTMVQPYAPMPGPQYLPGGASLQPTPQPALHPAEAIATVRSTEPAIGLPQDDRPVRLTAISTPAAAAPTMQNLAAPQQPPTTPAPEFTPAAAPTLVWNANSAPQVPQAVVAPAAYAPPVYTVGVQADQAGYVYQPTPRVRLPGYPAYPADAPMNGQVQVTELPPAGLAANPATPYVAQGQPAYGIDGFQPRGTMVQRPLVPATPEIR